MHKLFSSFVRWYLVSRACNWMMPALSAVLLTFSFHISLLFFNISLTGPHQSCTWSLGRTSTAAYYWTISDNVTVNLNHTVATVCVIAGIMQTSWTTTAVRPKLKILWRMPKYILYMCRSAFSALCAQRLVVQYRQRLYKENWNYIYPVLVVNFYVFISLSVF